MPSPKKDVDPADLRRAAFTAARELLHNGSLGGFTDSDPPRLEVVEVVVGALLDSRLSVSALESLARAFRFSD